MIRDLLVSLLVVLVFAGVIYLANVHRETGIDTTALAEYIIENFEEDTGADNAVAAIYLNYRVYDTLFEALLLLIAIVGIIHFFRIGLRRSKDE